MKELVNLFGIIALIIWIVIFAITDKNHEQRILKLEKQINEQTNLLPRISD